MIFRGDSNSARRKKKHASTPAERIEAAGRLRKTIIQDSPAPTPMPFTNDPTERERLIDLNRAKRGAAPLGRRSKLLVEKPNPGRETLSQEPQAGTARRVGNRPMASGTPLEAKSRRPFQENPNRYDQADRDGDAPRAGRAAEDVPPLGHDGFQYRQVENGSPGEPRGAAAEMNRATLETPADNFGDEERTAERKSPSGAQNNEIAQQKFKVRTGLLLEKKDGAVTFQTEGGIEIAQVSNAVSAEMIDNPDRTRKLLKPVIGIAEGSIDREQAMDWVDEKALVAEENDDLEYWTDDRILQLAYATIAIFDAIESGENPTTAIISLAQIVLMPVSEHAESKQVVRDELPIIEDLQAVRYAVKDWGKMIDAAKRGDWSEAAKHGLMGALNAATAIPLASVAAGSTRTALRQVVNMAPTIGRVIAQHAVAKAFGVFDKPKADRTAKNLMPPEEWRMQPHQAQQGLAIVFNHAAKRIDEVDIIELLKGVGYRLVHDGKPVDLNASQSQMLQQAAAIDHNRQRTGSIYNAMTVESLVDGFFGLLMRPEMIGKNTLETKTNGSGVQEGNSESEEIEIDNIAQMRKKLSEIPDKFFNAVIGELFGRYEKMPPDLHDFLIGSVQKIWRGSGLRDVMLGEFMLVVDRVLGWLNDRPAEAAE